MGFNVTLNNGLATVGVGYNDIHPVDSLINLAAASRLKFMENPVSEVAETLKKKAISEISFKKRVWEYFLALFFGCSGFQTSIQKIETLSLQICKKDYEIVKEKPPEEKRFLESEIGSYLENEPGFRRVNKALKKGLFGNARLYTYDALFNGVKLTEADRRTLNRYIIMKQIEQLFEEGAYSLIPELLIHIPERPLKKEILNKVERAKAESRFPQIDAFLKEERGKPAPNAGANFSALMEQGKLEEALNDLRGREPNRVIEKIALFYLEAGRLDEARGVIPFAPDINKRNELYEKAASEYLKKDAIKTSLEIYSLLDDESEGRTKQEAAKSLYSQTKEVGLALWALHGSPSHDAGISSIVSACLSDGNLEEAENLLSAIQTGSVLEQAKKIISNHRATLVKQAQLNRFAESYIEENFKTPLVNIHSKAALIEVIEDLEEKIKRLEGNEKQHACYDYLASLDHFELAYHFALKSPRRLSLKTFYGLYKEAEFENKIRKWMPRMPAMNEADDLKRAIQQLNGLKLRPAFFNHSVTYFKGKLIESYLRKGRVEEAILLAKTIRFVDVRAAVEACKA